jgi:hypothetical protein
MSCPRRQRRWLISRSISDSATTGLGKRGYQSLGARLLVMIRDRPCRSGDEFIEVVGVSRGELAHGEVVEDEHVGPHQFTDPFFPGAVRVAAGEFGEDPAGLGEADVGALADGEVAQRLGDVLASGWAGAPLRWWARVANTSRPPGLRTAAAAGSSSRGQVKSTASKMLYSTSYVPVIACRWGTVADCTMHRRGARGA